jgi:hypothetical protein
LVYSFSLVLLNRCHLAMERAVALKKDKRSMIGTLLRGRRKQVLLVLAFCAILTVISPPIISRVSQMRHVSSIGPPAGLVLRPTVRERGISLSQKTSNIRFLFRTTSAIDFLSLEPCEASVGR